jgi:hypothetical protein
MAATTAAVASTTTAVKATAATMEAAAHMRDAAATMIELRMMAATAPMVFPRMMDLEAGIVATPSISVRRVAIRWVTPTVVATVVIAAARAECDRSEQYDS